MELFKILGTIAISGAEKAEKDTEKVSNASQKSAKKIGESFKTVENTYEAIGKTIVKMAKVGVAAIGTVSTVVGALTKSAVENYAEYEQLVGGVETLFKDSADRVVEYANNAYKTAGLSANEYMDTVTSFSASLLQSLDGDTAKATESANLAITDMADNANKMGTAMESIQNAYQGFAKQNYTMLDNLKLGYGGTKEEMLRLLEDAEKISGIKYDISSFSDIVDAIHGKDGKDGKDGKNGKDAAIQSDTPPTDTSMLWLDTSLNPPLLKRYAPKYQLLVAEPSDWAFNYTTYFTFDSNTGAYSAITGTTTPAWAEDTYYQHVEWATVNDTTQAFYLMEKNVSSEISKSETNIMSKVSEEYYLKDETDSLISSVSTTVEQNKNSVEILFNQYAADLEALANGTDANFEEIRKYIRFVEGKILLGEVGNELELQIANNRISFLQSNTEVAYFSNNKLYVTDGEYTNSLRLGQFAFLPRDNGNLSFKKLV